MKLGEKIKILMARQRYSTRALAAEVRAVGSLLVARRITHTLTGSWAITASNPAHHSAEMSADDAKALKIMGRVL